MRFKTTGTPSQPAINLTPIIDAIFILLLFFAVTTTFSAINEIAVDLPKAETAEKPQERATVRVVITNDGRFHIDGVLVADGELNGELGKAYEIAPDATLVIEADTAATHGVVVRVIDAGKIAGFNNFAIATEEH